MNNKLDELGTALGNAKVELNNLIVEYKELTDKLNIDDDNRFLCSIARKSIEVHNLEIKWYDEEYKEFMCESDTHYFNDDDEYKYEDVRDDEHNDMDR